MEPPELVLEVTSRTGNCTGLIAELERTMQTVEPGARLCAVLRDVPTRVDVLAWAGRKGHRVVGERRDGPVIRIILEKGAAPLGRNDSR